MYLKTTVMTKQELKNQIGEIENQLHYVYDQGEQKTMKRQIRKLKKQIKAMTPEMGEGVTLTAQDFADNLSYSGKKDTPEKTFFKEESRRYDEQELEIIKKMAYYEQGIYDYFNKRYRPIPGTIKRIILAEHQEDVKSSNIYDRMCAKSSAEVRYEFQILPGYNKEPMTIIKEVKENTTLSRSDVYSFM